MEKSNAGVDSEMGADLDLGVEEGDSVSSAESEDDTDWKTLYEGAAVERDNYKTALTQKRQLRKPAPESAVEIDEDEDDDSKPLTRGEMRQMLQDEVVPIVAQGKVDTALTSMVSDPEKRKLVKLYYDTRIRQTGTSDDAIRSDIQAAIAIADGQKLRKASAEIDRANNNPRALPTGGSSADRGLPSKEHAFSKEQVARLTEQAKAIGADPATFIKKTWEGTKPR